MGARTVMFSVAALLLSSGCAGMSGNVQAEVDAGLLGKAKLAIAWENLPDSAKAEVKQAACDACAAILELRNTYRDQADATAGSSNPGLQAAHETFKQLADHYDSMVDECVEAQTLLGQCSHQ